MYNIIFLFTQKINPRLLALVSFVFFFSALNAQSDFRPGYIIGNDLDTIHGSILYNGENNLHRRCIFKGQINEEKQKIEAGDIYGYRFKEGKFYRSLTIPSVSSNPVYVEVLIEGFYNLFFFKKDDLSAYIIETDDGKLWTMSRKKLKLEREGKIYEKQDIRFRGILNIVFQDYPELKPLINRTDLEHGDMIKLIKTFHSRVCPEEQCIIYKAKKPSFNLKVIPYGGYLLSSHKMTIKLEEPYDKIQKTIDSSAGLIGVALDFNLPRLNDRFSIFVTGQLYKKEFGSVHMSAMGNRIVEYKYNFKDLRGVGTISLRYKLPERVITPFFSAGVYGENIISRDLSMNMSTELFTGEPYERELTVDYPDPNIFGFVIDMGVDLKVTPKNQIMINGSFFKGSGKSPVVNEKNSGLRFMLGYVF